MITPSLAGNALHAAPEEHAPCHRKSSMISRVRIFMNRIQSQIGTFGVQDGTPTTALLVAAALFELALLAWCVAGVLS